MIAKIMLTTSTMGNRELSEEIIVICTEVVYEKRMLTLKNIKEETSFSLHNPLGKKHLSINFDNIFDFTIIDNDLEE